MLQAQGNHFQGAPGGSIAQKFKSKIKLGTSCIECACLQINNLRYVEVLFHITTSARREA